MIISTDTANTFDKVQQPFMINTHTKMRMEGNFLNPMKNNYNKATADIILTGEKLEPAR